MLAFHDNSFTDWCNGNGLTITILYYDSNDVRVAQNGRRLNEIVRGLLLFCNQHRLGVNQISQNKVLLQIKPETLDKKVFHRDKTFSEEELRYYAEREKI